MKWVALVLMIVAIAGCTNDRDSVRTLEDSGFTDIELTGYEWMACSDSDTFHTGFRATNPRGKRVAGVVCCGLAKACTVRF